MYRTILDDFQEERDDLLAGLTLAQIIRPTSPTATALDGGPFDKKLSNDEYGTYRTLHGSFNLYKKGGKCQAEFDAVFEQAANPYELALKFFVQGVNYQDAKAKTFIFFILEALKSYSDRHPERHGLLDDSLKKVVFHLTSKDPNSSLFKLAASGFRFPESNQLFEEHVRNLSVQHQYVDAARFAQHCGLVHPDFVYAFLVPITFSRNQVSVVYDYLEVATALQIPLLSALDSLLTSRSDRNFKELVLFYGYVNLPQENLTFEYLRKNIPKLRKRFKIPLEATPNVLQRQNLGALEFWISKLAMCDADPSVFDDNIKSLVSKDNVESQVVLISKLLNHKLGLECVKWMRYFGIDRTALPMDIRIKIEYAERNEGLMGNRLHVRKTHNAYEVDRDRVEISFVSNATSFAKMISVLGAEAVEMIGFDAEWKPTYNEVTEVSLLQFATATHVFVVDKLSQEISVDLWRQLGTVFNRMDVVRIGFGCREDLAMMAKDATLGLTKAAVNATVDFFLLWQLLEKDYNKVLQLKYSSGKGLKDLVKMFLNKNLDKRMQMSDWSLRPLRPEQIQYAALDAYCLVDVYAEMKRRLAAKNVDVNEVLDKYQRKHYGKPR